MLFDRSMKDWGKKRSNKQAFKRLKKLIQDRSFWRELKNFCRVLKPIVALLRLVDSDMPTMGLVRTAAIGCAYCSTIFAHSHALHR